MECALCVRLEETRFNEALQVMAQRRSWNIHFCLDVTRSSAARASLDDVPQNLKPNRVPEGTELRSVAFQKRRHVAISNIFELVVNDEI